MGRKGDMTHSDARDSMRFGSVILHTFRERLCHMNIPVDVMSRQGTDWHSDQDRWLGDQPLVASISLGEERSLSVRLKTGPE